MPKYFATSAKGIEAVTAEELRRLGATEVEVVLGGVYFSGDKELLYRANLWLRTATRVLAPLKAFSAKTPAMLYDQVRRIKWEDLIPVEKTFAVNVTMKKGREPLEQAQPRENRARGRDTEGFPPHFAALKIKDAIVDQLRMKTGSRPNVETHDPDIRLHAHFEEGRCMLSVDSSGTSLHERGYRLRGAMAPLKETLAAALIELSGWDGKTPFLDPMCGSGTIALEAALKALNIAPGLLRTGFGFESWTDFDSELWTRIVEEAREQVLKKTDAPIVGFDIDRHAVASAIDNAKHAGLNRAVHFEKRDFDQLQPVGTAPGTLIMNPPYGERIGGEDAEIEALYKHIGDLLKQRMQGWTAFILTGNLAAAKRIGLHASKRFVFFNGPIECRLLRYDLYSGRKTP